MNRTADPASPERAASGAELHSMPEAISFDAPAGSGMIAAERSMLSRSARLRLINLRPDLNVLHQVEGSQGEVRWFTHSERIVIHPYLDRITPLCSGF